MIIEIKTAEEFHNAHVTIKIQADGQVETEQVTTAQRFGYEDRIDELEAEVLRLRGESEVHREEVIGLVRESDRLRVKICEQRTVIDNLNGPRSGRARRLDEISRIVNHETVIGNLVPARAVGDWGQVLADAIQEVRAALTSQA